MMNSKHVAVAVAILGLVGCTVPPVDGKLISNEPASARSFALAQRAVRACTNVTNRNAVLSNFRRAGFQVAAQKVKTKTGAEVERITVTAPDPSVSVLYYNNGLSTRQSSRCFVGLENMTPEQSKQLAQIWVKAHGAKPNSASGDGLSDHVSGAWRHFFTEPEQLPTKAAYKHRIYIAAYKTWPHGPYDPQGNLPYDISGVFPDRPGAAVALRSAAECQTRFAIEVNGGNFVPCSGAAYRPK